MSSTEAEDQLLRLIRKKSRRDCVRFFAELSPDARRPYANFAQKIYKSINSEWFDQLVSKRKPIFKKPIGDQLNNARICVIASATPGELKKLGWRIIPDDGFLVEVIRALKPDWTNQWMQELSETEPRMYHNIRLLYDAGLCDKPSGEGYVLGMIESLPSWRRAPSSLWDRETSLAERIRSTPDIRDEDIWRLFEVEGGGDVSLSNFDKYIGGKKTTGWTGALIELSDEGTLSRDRLLDESLGALGRDFAQFRAGWFSRFHEAMAPTLEERVTRRDNYLRLLGSVIPPTVSFALKAVLQLEKAGELAPVDVARFVGPVLQARAKGTVASGLKLIANAAKADPRISGELAKIATSALIHEAADVQKKALDVIDTLGGARDPELVAVLSDYANEIAPSLKSRLFEMIGSTDDLPETYIADKEYAEEVITDVVPVASFEEFLAEFLRALEDTSQPLLVERMLDGLARFGAQAVTDFDKLVGPLRKRSAAIIKRQPDDQLQYQIARLAFAFANADKLSAEDTFRYPSADIAPYSVTQKRERRSFEDTFLARNVDLLNQVQDGHQLPLLSAPTDSRGFVSTKALLSRFAAYKSARVKPGQIDTALAFMRLAVEDRESAATALQPTDEFEQALAFALGADASPGKTNWLWVAAAAARIPYVDVQKIAKKSGQGLPDAGTCARYSIAFEKTSYFTWLRMRVEPRIKGDIPSAFLTTRFHLNSAGDNLYGAVCGYHVNMIRWCSTLWPLNTEPFFSQGVFVFDHSQRLANSPYAGFLEPMLQSHVSIGQSGCVLLALGLASSDPAVKSGALEAAILSIEQMRVDKDALREAFIALIPSGHAPVGRWTKSLTELSGVSKKHAVVVRDMLEGSLRHDPTTLPRDIGGLLELLYELSVSLNSPVTDPATVEYLRGIGGSGKPKRFASKLIAQINESE